MRPLLVALALALLWGSKDAHADDPKRRPSLAERRANAEAAWRDRDFDYAGGIVTGTTYGSLHIDGRKADAPAPGITIGLEQALSYRALRLRTTGIGLTLLGRLTAINYEDRTLTQTDLALGPELSLLTRVVRPTVIWRFRVTGGYSLGFQGDHEGRAVIESYSTGSGPSFGTAVIAALSGPSVGGYLQLGTFHRFLSTDAHAELIDGRGPPATTKHEYQQHEVLLGGGLLLRF